MLSGSEASGVTNWWVWPTQMLRCRWSFASLRMTR